MKQANGTEALSRARRLRRDATPAEQLLWQRLRARQLAGAKFRRQVWLGPYIADFFCLEARLVVELDGGQHGGARDVERDEALSRMGYRTLRFWNHEVVDNLEGVLRAITAALPSPSRRPADGGPLPLPLGEEC